MKIKNNKIYKNIIILALLCITIGYAILRHKIPENKIGGNIGICLLSEYQGKELGKQVIEQLSLIALNEYGLDDIYITVKKENIRCFCL